MSQSHIREPTNATTKKETIITTSKQIAIGEIMIVICTITVIACILLSFSECAAQYEPITISKNDPISILMSDITAQGVANKSDYAIFTERPEDVYACTHISVNQARWIADNYGYKTGVVMLWSYPNNSHGINYSHACTWVEICNMTYVIESMHNNYWTTDEHKHIVSDKYEIEFVTTAQGQIHAINSSEGLSGHNVPIS